MGMSDIFIHFKNFRSSLALGSCCCILRPLTWPNQECRPRRPPWIISPIHAAPSDPRHSRLRQCDLCPPLDIRGQQKSHKARDRSRTRRCSCMDCSAAGQGCRKKSCDFSGLCMIRDHGSERPALRGCGLLFQVCERTCLF